MQIAPLTLRDDAGLVRGCAALFFCIALATAWFAPALFWLLLPAALAMACLFLCFLHTAEFCVAWLLIAGATIEMAVSDLVGPEAFQITIAAVKATQIGLAAICAMRFGGRLDGFNPAWGFVAMAGVGMVHGLYPGLSEVDSVRSAIGSVAPFAFCFCRPPLRWANAMIRATAWCPLVSVAIGLGLELAGIRPLFIESGGARLAAVGHPAFLAGVCLAATYAGLFEVYRHGQKRELALLGVNLALLVLTGARAPLMYAAGVIALSLMLVPSDAFPARARLLPVLAAGLLLPGLMLLSGELSSVRLFNMLSTDVANLSGRELLWPFFEEAADASPWFGWGVGAGNAIIPPDGPIARLLHTWAAHNEYLRIEVEGGQIGRALLIGLFIVWVWRRGARLCSSDRRIVQLMFVALALHAFTDNVLISTPACVLFSLVAAVFARGEAEAAPRRSSLPDSPPEA
jgi:O-antigen ligase